MPNRPPRRDVIRLAKRRQSAPSAPRAPGLLDDLQAYLQQLYDLAREERFEELHKEVTDGRVWLLCTQHPAKWDQVLAVPEGYRKSSDELRRGLDRMTRQYLLTALWAETYDEGRPLDSRYTLSDCSEGLLRSAIEDCAQLSAIYGQQIRRAHTKTNGGDPETKLAMAGHDFWLTRNGHGAGFEDGDWPEWLAHELAAYSQDQGEVCLDVFDGVVVVS
jgi:hypothetical protein